MKNGRGRGRAKAQPVQVALVAAIAASLLSTLPASAETVFVNAFNVDGTDQGRGVSVRANGRCYILVPNHVVAAAEKIQIVGRGGTKVSASVVKRFDDSAGSQSGGVAIDLAILEPEGGRIACDEALPDNRTIDQALGGADAVIVKRVDGSGQLENSAALVRTVGATEIKLTTGSVPEDALLPGDSGSLVFVGKVPVAMIVSKSYASGAVFTALRLDFLQNTANGYFASQRSPVKTFRFRQITVESLVSGSQFGAHHTDVPGLLIGMQPALRTDAERLLSASKGFPQIDNQSAPDQAAITATLSIQVVGFEELDNVCKAKEGKVLGLATTYYEPQGGSECLFGFEKLSKISRLTIRMSGEVLVGGSGARWPIQNQFTLTLPAEAGALQQPLHDEVSYRVCEVTRLAVNKALGLKGGNGMLGLGPVASVVPQLTYPKVKNNC